MIIRAARTRLAVLALLVVVATLTACGGDASETPNVVASGGGRILPPVSGFEYGAAGRNVGVFVDSASATLGGEDQVTILDAVIATRDIDQVVAIAFSFPGTTDEQAVDNMGRILDGMEDGFQAGSQPALGGKAWARVGGDLVFLFTIGRDQASRDLADAILSSGRE